MKQQNLNELRDIYLNIATGGEGPEVLSEGGTRSQFINNGSELSIPIHPRVVRRSLDVVGKLLNPVNALTRAGFEGAGRAGSAVLKRAGNELNYVKKSGLSSYDPTIQKPPAKPTPAKPTPVKPTPAKPAAAQRPAAASTEPAATQRPAATPTAPVKPAASAAPKPAASSANPMDTWARSNPGLARKVADSSTPQAGKDVISARVNADNDRGPSTSTSTPTTSSGQATTGDSGSTGSDRLDKALKNIPKYNAKENVNWSSAKTLKTIADAYSSVYEKKEYEPSRDQDEDDDNDFADNMIARMVASGMSRKEAIKKVKNRDYNKKDGLDEATRMAKLGYNETDIRNRIARNTRGGEAADRATALADKETFGRGNKAARQKYAATQRGDFRDTTSSNPKLHGYAHKSDDPTIKAKQAARGAQRGALTPREKKQLNREAYEIYEGTLRKKVQQKQGGIREETALEARKRKEEERNERWARIAELQASGRVETPKTAASAKRRAAKAAATQEAGERLLNQLLVGPTRRSERPMGSEAPAAKEAAPEANRKLKVGQKTDTLGSAASHLVGTITSEEYEIYEVILNHLLENGFAETEDDANIIIENMSSNWVGQILDEGYTKLPIAKMMKQLVRKSDLIHNNLADHTKTYKQIKKMIRTADRHSLIKGKGKVRGEGEARLNLIKGQNEDFELWVNNLLDEGYDLSDYTWDEVYDIYERKY